MQPAKKKRLEFTLLEFNQQVTTLRLGADTAAKLKQEYLDTHAKDGVNPYGATSGNKWSLFALKWLSEFMHKEAGCEILGEPLSHPYQVVQKMKYSNPKWAPGAQGKLSIQSTANPYGGGVLNFHVRNGDRFELLQWLKTQAPTVDLISTCPQEKPPLEVTIETAKAEQPSPKRKLATPANDDELDLILFFVNTTTGKKHLHSASKTWSEWNADGQGTALQHAKELAKKFLHDELGKSWDEVKLSTRGGLLQSEHDFISASKGGLNIMIEPQGLGAGRGGMGKGRGGSASNNSNSRQRSSQNAMTAVTNMLSTMLHVNCEVTVGLMAAELNHWREKSDKTPEDRLAVGALQVRCFLSQVQSEAEMELCNEPAKLRKTALEEIIQAMIFLLEEGNHISVTTTNQDMKLRTMSVPFTLERAVRTLFPQGSPPTQDRLVASRSFKLVPRQGAAGQLLTDMLTTVDWTRAFGREGAHPLFQARALA